MQQAVKEAEEIVSSKVAKPAKGASASISSEEYMRVKDGYLEVRVKAGKGRASASGKTMLIASTSGNIVIEGDIGGHAVTLGLNAYYKA